MNIASANGATGLQFEQQFNQAVQELLPVEALRLPMLPDLSSLPKQLQWSLKQPWETALEQTRSYLSRIGSKQNASEVLSRAFDSYILIANKYLASPQVHGTLYGGGSYAAD